MILPKKYHLYEQMGTFALLLTLIQISVVFILSFFGLYPLFSIPFDLLYFTKSGILRASIFTLFAFILYYRKDLLRIPSFKRNAFHLVIFSFLTLGSLFYYYAMRYLIHTSLTYFEFHKLLATILIGIPLVLFTVFLLLAFFTPSFISYFLKKFSRCLPLFFTVGIAYYFILFYFQKLWSYFSNIVAILAKKSFDLFYDTTLHLNTPVGPILTIDRFRVAIGAPCSGIDSMLLFTTLYFLIFFLDYRIIHRKRMLVLFLPGLIGIFLFNILRIFILLLMGLFVSAEFAVGLFHQNVGWLLFIIYFVLFYLATRKYIYNSSSKLPQEKIYK